ncbi:MAG: peptidyl-prolyl cis-trans isomerase [Verrucomicrobia bacterium]|nr:peptidyl-prolyl cis-trans isomerase [Verrucomicrobiota bacterium]
MQSCFLKSPVFRIAVAGWMVALAAGAAGAKTLFEDGYAAIVNDRVITVGDVLRLIQSADRRSAMGLRESRLKEALEQNYREGLEALIDRELVLLEAKRRELDLQDPMVDGQINQIVRERFGDNRAAFLSALATDGLSYADYREQIRNDLRVMLLRRQEVGDRILVTPSEVRAAYEAGIDKYREPEQVHVRLLVVRRGATDGEAAVKLKQARDALDRIAKGEPFADVARLVSEGPKASSGGDLGWMRPTDLRKELAAVVASLKPGQTGPVVDVGDEYHIVHLEARREASVKPLEEVRTEIERTLEKAAIEKNAGDWMSSLRTRHYVRIIQGTRP